MVLSTILLLVNLVLLLGLMCYLGFVRGDASAPTLPNEEVKKHIVWHSLYINPNDPRGWVPKTWGYGWTVNFRTKFFGGLFLLLILTQIGTAIILAMAAASIKY